MLSRRHNNPKTLQVLFRVEAEESLGLGHLSRCRSLARAVLEQLDCHICFAISRKDIGKQFLGEGLNKEIMEPDRIPVDSFFDVVIVDVPGIPLDEQKKLAAISSLLVGIDDDSPGPFYLDVLVRPNLLGLPKPDMTEKMTHYWQGKEYLILAPEFQKRVSKGAEARDNNKTGLICLGGSDPAGLTLRLVPFLKEFTEKISFTIILGTAFPNPQSVEDMVADESEISVIVNCRDMAAAFSRADFCIISGGTLLYEALSFGLPALVWCQNDEQYKETELLAKAGAAVNLGLGANVGDQAVAEGLRSFLADEDGMKEMAKAAGKQVCVDGVFRIVNQLEALLKKSIPERNGWRNNHTPYLNGERG
jgi:spore coat polysaccharide biosynthesis predicted glycosyltransferase SpsG